MMPSRTVRRASSRSEAPSGRRPRHARSGDGPQARRIELIPPVVLLVVALLIGGSANPIGDMVVDCLAVLLLALLAIRFDADDWRRSRIGWLVLLATLAVAAVELVPLPYALWRTLPGRAQPAAILDALGLSGPARPLSLDPNATRSTLVQVLPGIAILTAALAAGVRTRRTLVSIVIAAACVCVVLGTFQITGQQQFYLYEKSNFGDVTGLFANHNHAADLLLIGIALLAGRMRAIPRERSGPRLLIGALMLTLGVAVLLTASRFGIVLLAAEAAAIVLFLRPPSTRRDWVVAGIVLAACAGVAALLTLSASIGIALDRFNDFSSEFRGEIWRGSVAATARYWPVGSGLGTFVPVYAGVERLDVMPTQIVNHAHNEYLELLCELGLVGAVLVLGYLAALAACLWAHVRQRSVRTILPPLLGILVLLVHSLVEFPLRNGALMVSFGLLNALLFGAVRCGDGVKA